MKLGGSTMALNGMLIAGAGPPGGVMLLQVGVAVVALRDLNTCPGAPGVPSSKPPSVAYRMFASVGLKARSVMPLLGTWLSGSRSVYVAPPLVVMRNVPLLVPTA